MSFRSALLPRVRAVRAIPQSLGVRTSQVFVRTRAADGTVTDLEILPRPRIEEVDGADVINVGPITPSHAGGGYTIDQLAPARTGAGVSSYYRVVGPRGVVKYALGTMDTTRAWRYMLRLVAIDRPDEVADY